MEELAKAEPGSLTETEVVAQVLMSVIQAWDVSNFVSRTAHSLGRFPEVQEMARAEIQAAFAKHVRRTDSISCHINSLYSRLIPLSFSHYFRRK
jgi:hypothetical protein